MSEEAGTKGENTLLRWSSFGGPATNEVTAITLKCRRWI